MTDIERELLALELDRLRCAVDKIGAEGNPSSIPELVRIIKRCDEITALVTGGSRA